MMHAFRKWRALGVAFAITLTAGLALAQQTSVGGLSARSRLTSLGVGQAAPAGTGNITATGTVTAAAVTASGTVTATNFVGTVGGIATSDLARLSAANTFTAALGGSSASLILANNSPGMIWTEADAAVDNKSWRLYASAETLSFPCAINDAFNSENCFVTFDRTGVTRDTINLQATTVQVNGTAVATQTSGSFTATMTGCTANPSATAYYRISAGVVTLAIPPLNCTSNAATANITGIPAAIQPGVNGGFNACGPLRDNSVDGAGSYQLVVGAPTAIALGKVCGVAGGLTSSGSRVLGGAGFATFTYHLTN